MTLLGLCNAGQVHLTCRVATLVGLVGLLRLDLWVDFAVEFCA